MVYLEDLSQLADELRKLGIDAAHEYLYGSHGCIEGLDVCDEFFPHWELSLPENAAALEKADFAAIKQRRAADWNAEGPPRPARAYDARSCPSPLPGRCG